jgi:hypothetical protein
MSVTIPVSTFTIDFVFENSFLSAMTPYVDSRDGRSLSIYEFECQIWKTFTTMFTAIDPNKDISKTRQVHVIKQLVSKMSDRKKISCIQIFRWI